jgi:mannitol/fructose-specific phosphotransferase system IIA component (Ntr-type)
MENLQSFSNIHDVIADGDVLKDLPGESMPEVITDIVGSLVKRGLIKPDLHEKCLKALLDREEKSTTAIGHAVALPHARIDGIEEPLVAFGRLADPVDMGAPDEIPTRFIFLIINPPVPKPEHFELLINISKLMADAGVRRQAEVAETHKELVKAFNSYHERSRRLPRPKFDESPKELQFTGRFAGGFFDDIRRRIPHYFSDFKDGFNFKSVASVLFLYFACLAAAVAFGGLMGYSTNGAIGVTEMITATAICGVIYALTSGQPLTILGGTGPLLVFTTMLYGMCEKYQIPFLPTYAWVGIWAGLFTVILSVTDSSALIRFCTRFTDEIFAALISVIFIFEAINNIVKVFTNNTGSHDTPLLTLILAIGTYWVASSLKNARQSKFMRPKIREFLSDFGTVIAIGAMTGVSIWLHMVDVQALAAPKSFGTTSGRPWLVDIFEVSWTVRGMTIIPALLATVLIFLDQNITARLVNKSDNNLVKGAGYHLDLFVVGALIIACSMFGLPWLVAATVRSLNHVHSLATIEGYVDGNGDVHERISNVKENRLSGLGIHILIGSSLLFLPLLKNIPMPVLFGIFLYMGVASLTGNQFFDRLKLWFMDSTFYPATHYMRRVKTKKIHIFTFIQLLGLIVLWVVKTSTVALLFPVAIAALVPLRSLLMPKWFSEKELEALDSEEEVEDEIYNVAS